MKRLRKLMAVAALVGGLAGISLFFFRAQESSTKNRMKRLLGKNLEQHV